MDARTYSDVKAKLIKAQSSIEFKSETGKHKDEEKYEFWLTEWLRAKRIRIKDSTYIRYRNDDPNALYKTKIIVTEPKSKASVRTIPLPDFVINAIKPFLGSPNAYVLSGNCQEIIEPRTMQNRFKGYLEAGQISDANFHSLRHTFATRCIEAGFDVKTLSEILGHSSVKITLDRYVHSSMELKRSNMEKLTPVEIK